jgi:hypothetical protein
MIQTNGTYKPCIPAFVHKRKGAVVGVICGMTRICNLQPNPAFDLGVSAVDQLCAALAVVGLQAAWGGFVHGLMMDGETPSCKLHLRHVMFTHRSLHLACSGNSGLGLKRPQRDGALATFCSGCFVPASSHTVTAFETSVWAKVYHFNN